MHKCNKGITKGTEWRIVYVYGWNKRGEISFLDRKGDIVFGPVLKNLCFSQKSKLYNVNVSTLGSRPKLHYWYFSCVNIQYDYHRLGHEYNHFWSFSITASIAAVTAWSDYMILISRSSHYKRKYYFYFFYNYNHYYQLPRWLKSSSRYCLSLIALCLDVLAAVVPHSLPCA